MASKLSHMPNTLSVALSQLKQAPNKFHHAFGGPTSARKGSHSPAPQPPAGRNARDPSDDAHPDTPPVPALLDVVPRLRMTYWVTNSGRRRVATGRHHYRIVTSHGRIVRVSDNLLDIIRLIDGQRSVREITTVLAAQQCRPVHPIEIVYLIRTRLAPARLVHLPATPARITGATQDLDARSLLVLPPGADLRLARRTHRLTPTGQPIDSALSPRPERSRHIARTSAGRALITVAASILIFAVGAGLGLGLGHHGWLFGGQQAQAKPATTQLSVKSQGPTPAPTPNPYATSTYVWRAGDNLTAVARQFHMPPQIILEANNLASANGIQPGTALIIPSRYRPGLNPLQMQHPIYYVVQPGDTLSSIAVTFNATTFDIDSMNNITDYTLLFPGQGLLIP
jgi:LysM repeat protein